MNDKFSSFVTFAAGVAVGTFITYKMLDRKYKRIADDEIESVKEMFNRKLKNKDKQEKETKNKSDYNGLVDSLGYKNDSDKKEGKEDMAENAKVYVIPPEDFGEYGYDTISLTYYADKVLAYNMTNKVIKNVDEVVGKNSLETFGEYEDDSVFVRNEDMKKDIEILLDTRKYSDIVTSKPHLMTEDE